MRVGKIRNRYARRFAIVALSALWVVTFVGCAVGMIIEEAYFGALLALGASAREWEQELSYLKANIGRIW